MQPENPVENNHLAAAAIAALTAQRATSNGSQEPSAGKSESGLTALIQIHLASSASDTDVFLSFLRTPGDAHTQDQLRLVLERKAASSQVFRDQLASAIHNEHTMQDRHNGVSNVTTVTNSTLRGRGHNLGILTQNRHTRISVGLGGLLALLAIGGGVGAGVVVHSPPSSTTPAVTPSADLPLADGEYVYTESKSDPSSCEGTMLRWIMKGGVGSGTATFVSNRSGQTDESQTDQMAEHGTPHDLTFIVTPQTGSSMAVTRSLTGDTLTTKWPVGLNGSTPLTLHKATPSEWDSFAKTCVAREFINITKGY
jgi:hypothetical protein